MFHMQNTTMGGWQGAVVHYQNVQWWDILFYDLVLININQSDLNEDNQKAKLQHWQAPDDIWLLSGCVIIYTYVYS